MLRNSGDHTTPVPWYGQPDAWYGQPDPWFGQPFVPGHTADAARAPGRPGRTPQPPARARPAPAPAPAPAEKVGAAAKGKPKRKPKAKGKPASKGQAAPGTAAQPLAPVPVEGPRGTLPKALPKALAKALPKASPKALPKAPVRPPAKEVRPAAGTAPAAGGATARARRPSARPPARPATGGAVRPAAGQPRQVKLTRRGRGAVGVLLCSVLVTGVVLTFHGVIGGDGPPQPSAASAALPDGAAGSIKVPPPLPPAQPTRIRVGSVSIDAPIMNVGLDSRGIIAAPPPEKAGEAAWFKDSVSPGARGASVIVGHVDNESGPAVFYSLGALKKGSTIDVVRDDGSTATFTIYGIEVFTKAEFPAKRVYGDTKDPELRVITCGGTYSRDSGYSGNVVVFARLSKTKTAKV